MAETKDANQTGAVASEKKDFSAADAVKAFARKNIVVRMPKTDKQGNPQRATKKDGTDAGLYVTEEFALAAEHVIAHRKERGVVTIVTLDGARYRSNDAAE